MHLLAIIELFFFFLRCQSPLLLFLFFLGTQELSTVNDIIKIKGRRKNKKKVFGLLGLGIETRTEEHEHIFCEQAVC